MEKDGMTAMDDGLESQEDFLKRFGQQRPRWGTTPAITEREVTQLKRIAEGCQPWDAQGEMKKLTARVIKLEMLVNELINQQLRGY